MALLWVEGFEDYGTATGSNLSATILQERYTNNTAAQRLIAGRATGYGITCYDSGSDLYTPSLTTNSTIVVGGAWKYIGSPITNDVLRLYDGATLGVNLSYNATNGTLIIKTGSTTLGSIVTSVLSNVWLYLELKVVCNSSTGSAILRVNGTTVLTLTGQNTQAGSHSYHDIVDFVFQASQSGAWDDIYILDGSGSVNNDFLGVQKVMCMYPTGDSGSEEWTTSSGANHYALVNEQVEDADTTYVVNTSSPQVDMFTHGSISGSGTINGIQVNTAVRETDGTPHSLITRVISGSTTSDDAGQSVGVTSYVNKKRILETDPNTSAAWTPTNLSSATIGIKV